jgi:hypothetical protein
MKVYKWEIFDSTTGTVVSDGIGEVAEKKALAYLRSVYGCHLKSRGKRSRRARGQSVQEDEEEVHDTG